MLKNLHNKMADMSQRLVEMENVSCIDIIF